MSESNRQVSVDINYCIEAKDSIGLGNLMRDVGENMAYRLEKLIREQGLEETPLKMFATLSFAEITPSDRWIYDGGAYRWESRPSESPMVSQEFLDTVSSALEEARKNREAFAQQLLALWDILAKHDLAPAPNLSYWQQTFQL